MFCTPYNGTKQAKAFVLTPKKSTMNVMVNSRRAVAKCMFLGYAPTKSLVNNGRRLGASAMVPQLSPSHPTSPFK